MTDSTPTPPNYASTSTSPGNANIPPQQPAAPQPTQVIIQQPRRRNTGWKIVTVILILVLLCSIGANFLGLVLFSIHGAGGSAGSANIQRETIRRGGSDKVAILPVVGEIDGTMADRVRRFCDAIIEDDSIKVVVVEVDSPGGTVTSSDEIHHMFTQLVRDHQKKLVVSMGSMAASGGYYISMPAEKLYAEPTTITGSIGVIWPAFEVSDLLQKIGVTPEVIASSEAVHKDTGSPMRKFTDDDRSRIRALVNDAHAKFRAIVQTGRAKKLTVPMEQIATGDIWPADKALSLGIIDGIAYLDEVCTRSAAEAGITNPTIIRLKEFHGLFDMLSASSTPNNTKVSVEFEPRKILHDLQTPRMEYRFVP